MRCSSINSLLASFVILACASCEERQIVMDLEQFGTDENTTVEIIVHGASDSLEVKIHHYQQLYGWFKIDTTLEVVEGAVEFREKLALEKPSIVNLYCNDRMREIFLIPGLDASILVRMNSTEMTIEFENEDLAHINEYCRTKAEIGGDLYMRQALTNAMTQPTLSDAIHALDSLEATLYENLMKNEVKLHLPPWFLDFEKKNIQYMVLSKKSNSRRVRHLIFGIDDPVEDSKSVEESTFPYSDEQALPTESYLSSLINILGKTADADGSKETDPISFAHLIFENSELLDNSRIRDLVRSGLFYRMVRSSIHYPDSLLSLVKQGITAEMQPYVERIEAKYRQFNGVAAPAMHLRDKNDSLVSLQDFRGNLILLDFWFVGCPFCTKENPHTRALVDEFQDEHFKVLQICMKTDRSKWEELRDSFPGIALYSNEHWDKKLTNTYKISGYPRYVLIDEYGIVIEGWCERPSDPGLRKRILKHFESKSKSSPI